MTIKTIIPADAVSSSHTKVRKRVSSARAFMDVSLPGSFENVHDLLPCWSRGRELNSRPADYEMSSFALSRWFSISRILPLSLSFALVLRANLQRYLQRIPVAGNHAF